MKRVFLIALCLLFASPAFATAFDMDFFSSDKALKEQKTEVTNLAENIHSFQAYKYFYQKEYMSFLFNFGDSKGNLTQESTLKTLSGMPKEDLLRFQNYLTFLDTTLEEVAKTGDFISVRRHSAVLIMKSFLLTLFEASAMELSRK